MNVVVLLPVLLNRHVGQVHIHVVHFGDGVIILHSAEATEAVLEEVGFQGPEGGDLKWRK